MKDPRIAQEQIATWVAPSLWLLSIFCVVSQVVSIALHLSPFLAGAMLALSLLLFGVLHGGVTYGGNGIFVFIFVCFVVSNTLENLSVLTGFPFGWYYYSDAMGPRLFKVPLLIGPAYFGVGYLSWTLARAILGDVSARLNGILGFGVPVTASFIMVAWDLTMDPIMSTIKRNWIWRDGGSYFGVPLSNFTGWYLTVYLFFQIFALYVRRVPPAPRRLAGYWAMPLFAYTSIVVAPVLDMLFNGHESAVLVDPAGQQWLVGDIHAVLMVVGLFTVLPFWCVAVFRVVGDARVS